MKKLLYFSLVLLALTGCKAKGKMLPNVSGAAGEILVVVDKGSWDGIFGEAVREVLAAECPALPQPEPKYDLTNITPGNFTQMFHIHRNLILTYIDASVEAPGVTIRYDVWAHPQIVVRINARTAEDATALFKENAAIIESAIEQTERDRIIANTMRYQESSLCEVIKNDLGAEMFFPSGYKLKSRKDDFIWIAYETVHVQQGILVYKYRPVDPTTEYTKDKLLTMRNLYLQENVPGMFEGSYMTTALAPAPELRYIHYKGRDFAEIRGLWEVYNDFMGGPFVSHSFYSEDGSEIINICAYVYAPKFDKRQYLRQVESILYSYKPLQPVEE